MLNGPCTVDFHQTPLRARSSDPTKRCFTSNDRCVSHSFCAVGKSACPEPVVTVPAISNGEFNVVLPNEPHRFVSEETKLTVKFQLYVHSSAGSACVRT